MPVRIVTDSTADLPREIRDEYGIIVVPLNVHFGQETYRDGLDLNAHEFFERLAASRVPATTSQPAAGTFAEAYRQAAVGAEGIVSIHISRKLSGTYDSAIGGRGIVSEGHDAVTCPIEVVDTEGASMVLGLPVIAAAEAARNGAGVEEVAEVARHTAARTYLLMFVDTLEYLLRGGRVGRARAFIATVLNVKPLITLEEGEIAPAGRIRTRARAIDSLYEFAAQFTKIDAMALLYAAAPESVRADAERLADRLSALFPRDQIYFSNYGPVIGAHLGPGAIGLIVTGDRAGALPG